MRKPIKHLYESAHFCQPYRLFSFIPQIDPAEIEMLTDKIEQNKLDERERRLIAALELVEGDSTGRHAPPGFC
jgi:hypothetical protein